jgi:hypothetical protein
MEPIQPEVIERNRELIAERLGWPAGALEAVRQLEAQHPGYSVFWGKGRVSDPRPGFYAMRGEGFRRRTFYGATAANLSAALAADAAQHPAQWWER